MSIEVINLPTVQRSNAGINEGAASTRAQATNTPSNRAESETEKAPYSDTVTFTETATQLQEMANNIADIPVVDMARVEAMQYRLENGGLEIDTNNLASNILRFETQLQPK